MTCKLGTMMDKHSVLVALGPGGTTELAERVLELLAAYERGMLDSVTTVLGELELGGLSEVCTVLGKSRQQVGHWIAGRRGPGNFPEPLVELTATPVWNLASVREWATENGLAESSEEPIHA